MENYQNAGEGLRKMFVAQVGILVCTVLALIPVINIFAMIGVIVFSVISLVGLYGAGKDIEGCKQAFLFTIIQIIVNLLGSFLNFGILGSFISLAQSILSLLITYFVCTSVANVLNSIGQYAVAERGYTVWKINLACFVISIVLTLLALLPILNAIAVIGVIAVGIISIVAGILYMIFLYKSYQAFGA